MSRYIAICSICDEGTNEPEYCERCGTVFCQECAEGNITEQGNGSDDIEFSCNDCVNMKARV